jgi:hypothetical protein
LTHQYSPARLIVLLVCCFDAFFLSRSTGRRRTADSTAFHPRNGSPIVGHNDRDEPNQDLVAEKIVMIFARSTTPLSTTTAPIKVIIEALIESLLDGYLSATTSAILCRELVLRLPSASYPPVSGGNHFILELGHDLQKHFDKEWKLISSSDERSDTCVDLTRGIQYDQQHRLNLSSSVTHDYSQMHIPIANIFKAGPQSGTPC